MQHDATTNKTDSTKSSDKKSWKINLTYLEGNGMTDEIVSMTASLDTNYHIVSNEIDRIFDGNTINCTEVKNSTPDDCEQLKD